jgi:hypothetical protein
MKCSQPRSDRELDRSDAMDSTCDALIDDFKTWHGNVEAILGRRMGIPPRVGEFVDMDRAMKRRQPRIIMYRKEATWGRIAASIVFDTIKAAQSRRQITFRIEWMIEIRSAGTIHLALELKLQPTIIFKPGGDSRRLDAGPA